MMLTALFALQVKQRHQDVFQGAELASAAQGSVALAGYLQTLIHQVMPLRAFLAQCQLAPPETLSQTHLSVQIAAVGLSLMRGAMAHPHRLEATG
jgi:hypothetical protein